MSDVVVSSQVGAALRCFSEKTWFAKPNNREYAVSLKKYVENEMPQYGGILTKKTTTYQFKMLMDKYERVMCERVNNLMRNDRPTRQAMRVACVEGDGEGPTAGADGQALWTLDPFNEKQTEAITAQFNALSQTDQRYYEHLVQLVTDFALHFSHNIVDESLKADLVQLHRRHEAANQFTDWDDWKTCVKRDLYNTDAEEALKAVMVTRRPECGTLQSWMQTVLFLKEFCDQEEISLPKKVWFKVLSQQVSKAEIKAAELEFPKSQDERDSFSLTDCETKVDQADQAGLPVFHTSQVAATTKEMVVEPSSVRQPPKERVNKNKNNNKDNSKGGSARYCRFCLKKHKRNEHTPEGDNRYKEWKKDPNKSEVKDSQRISRKDWKKKDYDKRGMTQPGKRKRQDMACFRCGSNDHFKAQCPEGAGYRKTGEQHNQEEEEDDSSDKLTLKSLRRSKKSKKSTMSRQEALDSIEEQKALVAESQRELAVNSIWFSEHFTFESWAGEQEESPRGYVTGSNIARVKIKAASFVTPKPEWTIIDAALDSGASNSTALKEYVRDAKILPKEHWLTVRGLNGFVTFKIAGHAVIPNKAGGCYIPKVYVTTQKHMPRNCAMLLCKKDIGRMDANILKLCKMPITEENPMFIQQAQPMEKAVNAKYVNKAGCKVKRLSRFTPRRLHPAYPTMELVQWEANGTMSYCTAAKIVDQPPAEPDHFYKSTPGAVSQPCQVQNVNADDTVDIEFTQTGAIAKQVPRARLEAIPQPSGGWKGAIPTHLYKASRSAMYRACVIVDDNTAAKKCSTIAFVKCGAIRGGVPSEKLVPFQKKLQDTRYEKPDPESMHLETVVILNQGIESFVPNDRKLTPEYHKMLSKYTAKYKRLTERKKPESIPDPLNLADRTLLDVWNVFDGPTGETSKTMRSNGLITGQSLDRANEKVPWDISSEVGATAMILYCLTKMPWVTVFSPECTVWCKAQDFNNGADYQKRLAKRKDQETKLMASIEEVMRAIKSYGGHMITENPETSKFWLQSFWKRIEARLPGRSVTLNLCQAGGDFYKQYRFYTTLPLPMISHMQRACDHTYRHPRCVGRSADGTPNTKITSAYTGDTRAMLCQTVKAACGKTIIYRPVKDSEEGFWLGDMWLAEGENSENLLSPTHLHVTETGRLCAVNLSQDKMGNWAGKYCDTNQPVEPMQRDLRIFKQALKNKVWDPGGTKLDFAKCDMCSRDATHHEWSADHYVLDICDHCCSCNNEINFFIPEIGECYLSQQKLESYWERVKDDPPKKQNNVEDVRIGDNVPQFWKNKVRAKLLKHRRVFESVYSGKPLAVVGGRKHIRLIPGAKPQWCREPRWGHGAKNHILDKWARLLEDAGLLVPSISAWASRPHIAMKTKRGKSKDDPDHAIRVCGDYVMVNTQIEMLRPPPPNISEQFEKAAGKPAYWYTDAEAMYHAYELDKESQELTAVWTPRGLRQWTRWPFGLKNAGTITQSHVRQMMIEEIPDEPRKDMINIADDFGGYTVKLPTGEIDWKRLYESFAALLEMMDKKNMSLKPSKTYFGDNKMEFFGHVMDENGYHQAEHNLQPFIDMVPPENVSGVRRILGLFVQAISRIEWYAVKAKPLTILTRKAQPWIWGAEQQAAFDQIRAEIMLRPNLHPPDYLKQFWIITDASDQGKGCVLYQLKDETKPDTIENRLIIKYFSKAWDNKPQGMRTKPPYYREADAMLWGMGKGKPYANISGKPLRVGTDHCPLQWIKTAAKGAVVGWRIEETGDLNDYRITYYPGNSKEMIIPDALSRNPMLGPRRLARVGVENAVRTLLNTIPDEYKKHEIWLWAGKDTAEIAKIVKTWKGKQGRVTTRAPKETFQRDSWGFGIIVPRSEEATSVAAQAVRQKRPVAVLMPTDLVHYASQKLDKTTDIEVQSNIEAAMKIQLTAPLLTWVLHNIPVECDQIFIGDSETVPPGTGGSILEEIGTLEDWITEQAETMLLEDMIESRVLTYSSGLRLYETGDGLPKIIVPKGRRRHLWKQEHLQSMHLGPNKNVHTLSKYYWWPTMKKDVHEWFKECQVCEIGNAKRNRAHRQYRCVEGSVPRSRWGMDFIGVADKEVLGCIDKDSLWVELFALPDRTTDRVVKCITDGICFRHGIPAEITSDHAREFISKAYKQCARQLQFRTGTTMGHNAAGNSTIESFWQYFNKCLRIMTDDEYQHFDRHLQQIAWGWNTTHSQSLSVLPFEVMTGMAPRTVAATSVTNRVADDAEVNLSNIKVAAQEFQRVAKLHGDYMRTRRAESLNSTGRELKEMKIGEYVKIFKPPSHAAAVRRQRKQKHMWQWSGPYLITGRPSKTTFELEHYWTKKPFSRALLNVRKWRGAIPKGPPQATHEDADLHDVIMEEIVAGDILAVIQDEDAKEFSLALVNEATEGQIDIHCYGTTGTNLKTAKFHLLYEHEDTGAIHLDARKPASKKFGAWEFGLSVHDTELVLATGLQLKADQTLNSDSLRHLTTLQPIKHRRHATKRKATSNGNNRRGKRRR